MQRLRFIAAIADDTSNTLFNSFWNCLPRSITERYTHTWVTSHSPFDIFEHLAALPVADLMHTMVLVEVPSEEYLPWSVSQIGLESRGGAVSLILSFPEVYFVFVGKTPAKLKTTDLTQARWDAVVGTHFLTWSSLLGLTELLRHHIASFRTIFDPSGLRALLKASLHRIAIEDGRGSLFESEVRERLVRQAAAADEEVDYVYLHGYCLYKLGYATCLLGSEEEFLHQLSSSDDRWKHVHSAELLVTDWDLAYADHEERVRASSPEEGASSLVMSIEGLDADVLVVSGYTQIPELTEFVKNGGGRPRTRRAMLAKPHSGIYAVNASIRKLVGTSLERQDVIGTKGFAGSGRKKEKPGEAISATPQTDDATGPADGSALRHDFFRHSLPYGRALIANFLLDRATELHRDQSNGVLESILQATLALEAKELLGGLSRTTAYEAIYLQTDGELSAELSWFGINSEAEVDTRIEHLESESALMREKEMQRASAVISLREDPERSRRELEKSLATQEAHFLYRVLDLMREKYNSSGQIFAGEKCHRKIMDFHSRIPKLDDSWIASYVRLVTGDGTKINYVIYASVIVILFSSICYWVLLALLPDVCLSFWRHMALAFGNGVFSFVGLQPGLDEYKDLIKEAHPNGWWKIGNFLVALLEMLVAYMNLGLLLSVVYRKLTRATV